MNYIITAALKIFIYLKEILKCRITQDMKQFVKHPKYSDSVRFGIRV